MAQIIAILLVWWLIRRLFGRRRKHRHHAETRHVEIVEIVHRYYGGPGHYADFVAEMWAKPGVSIEGVRLILNDEMPVTCEGHSVVEGNGGHVYVNVLVDGEPKTYSGDARHRWLHNGQLVRKDAFLRMLKGTKPKRALHGGWF